MQIQESNAFCILLFFTVVARFCYSLSMCMCCSLVLLCSVFKTIFSGMGELHLEIYVEVRQYAWFWWLWMKSLICECGFQCLACCGVFAFAASTLECIHCIVRSIWTRDSKKRPFRVSTELWSNGQGKISHEPRDCCCTVSDLTTSLLLRLGFHRCTVILCCVHCHCRHLAVEARIRLSMHRWKATRCV